MNIATAALRAEPHSEIGTLLQRHAHTIIDRWCNAARDEQTSAARVHHVVLRDDLPGFLEAMGRALGQSGTADTAAPAKAAKEHGQQRWDSGWSLTELVRDYQLLRVVVLEFLEGSLQRALYSRETLAVGVFIDDAIAASISRYVAHREEALKRSEQERSQALEDLGRRKDEFLAILGHELRNPLAPIRNSLAVLRHVLGKTNPAVTTSLDVLDRQSRQLGRLVDDLLDIGRVSRGEFELRKSQVDLKVAIEQALQTTRPLIEERGHRLHLALPENPVYLHADAHRVTQIAANLLSNAAKYTDAGGNIWVSIERTANDVSLRVRDDGIGIAADQLSRVFELFARIDQPQTASREGLGIGLALVQRLVQQHGGSISAHSDGLGRGAEFTVCLPLMSKGPAPAPLAQTAASPVLLIKQVPVDKL